MTPNPSIERTATGKPASAAHVKRWAYPNSARSQSMKTNPPQVFRAEVAAPVVLGCPSAGGQRILGATAAATAGRCLSSRPVSCGTAPLRMTATARTLRSVAQGARLAVGMPNPTFEPTATGVPASAAQLAR